MNEFMDKVIVLYKDDEEENRLIVSVLTYNQLRTTIINLIKNHKLKYKHIKN